MDTQSQLAGFGLFDARVPRYTSYPTAPQFTDKVGERDLDEWILAIPPRSEISLYIHVPFCRRLCWFCACRTQGTSSDKPVAAYLETLKAEIALLKQRLPDGIRLSRLHWGGGTPTLLQPGMIADLAGTIFDAVPLGADAEFSVEIDPNEIDEARLDALAAAGLSRASIGVQDFDSEIQKVIGRIQSFDLTKAAVEMIRDRDIASLNCDILYGLPHQTEERIAESVQKLLSLSPDRVALYGYAHVPWMARRQAMIPTEALPDAKSRLTLFETARKLFVWDGYSVIGIDHFARQGDGLEMAQRAGRLRRNFQGYTDDTAEVLIGLGASSISRFPQGFAQNASGTSDYTGRVRSGHLTTHRGHVFSADDHLRGRIIEALMCDFSVSTAELQDRFEVGRDTIKAMFLAAAEKFDGMVRVTAAGFEILPEGRPLTRMIARAFDAYALSEAGHSSAV